MRWRARATRYLARFDRFPWLLIAVTTAVLLLAVAASVVAYLSVAQALTTPSLAASFEPRYVGTASNGSLLDNGTVVLTVRWTVTNPSPRALTFDAVSYKAWIEDLPAEAGLSNLGRTDILVTNASGAHLLYLAYFDSVGVSPASVPAGGQATQALEFSLSKSNRPAFFAAVRNITEYAGSVRGNSSGIPWFGWTEITLRIDGVPEPPSSSAIYEFTLGRVILAAGVNYGA